MGKYNKVKKIVVCPDSFKGSLSSREGALAIAEGLRKGGFKGEIIECPLSDGGEGMNEILSSLSDMRPVTIPARDALLRRLDASYLIDASKDVAFIESARFVGLELIDRESRNPMKASSRGLGIAIADAVDRGIREIFISLGGSAVCDCGMGMLDTLGIVFYDSSGIRLQGNGQEMGQIDKIEGTGFHRKINEITFHAVCDVKNPLLGPTGAVRVFAPQKGAAAEELPVLEQGMENFACRSIEAGFGTKEDVVKPGAGAAGGLGFALYAYMKANHLHGIDFLLDYVGFDRLIADTDLIITGEGRIDRQSLMGKVVSGILTRARVKGIPVIAFGGLVTDRRELESAGLAEAIEISNPRLSHEQNMAKSVAMDNLSAHAAQLM